MRLSTENRRQTLSAADEDVRWKRANAQIYGWTDRPMSR
jgi:hypothetical protein